MKKRYFAIGLKGWVQIRVALKPPVAVSSEATRTIMTKTLKYIPGEVNFEKHIYKPAKYEEITKPKDVVMRVTVFEGGKVLQTIKATKFTRLLKITLHEDAMIELLPEQALTLKAMEE